MSARTVPLAEQIAAVEHMMRYYFTYPSAVVSALNAALATLRELAEREKPPLLYHWLGAEGDAV